MKKPILALAIAILIFGTIAKADQATSTCEDTLAHAFRVMNDGDSVSAVADLKNAIGDYDRQSNLATKDKGTDQEQDLQAAHDSWQQENGSLETIRKSNPLLAARIGHDCQITLDGAGND